MSLAMKYLFSSIWSLLFLVSTNAYAINTHYCEDVAVDWSFVADAPDCGMEDTLKESLVNYGFNERPCCEQKTDFIESGVDNFQSAAAPVIAFPVLIQITYLALVLDIELENDTIIFSKEAPLLRWQNQPEFLQVYII